MVLQLSTSWLIFALMCLVGASSDASASCGHSACGAEVSFLQTTLEFGSLQKQEHQGSGTCVSFPTDEGDNEQMCSNGNLNDPNSAYTYVYNSRRGKRDAKCGQYADCWCCTESKVQVPMDQGSGTCVSFPTDAGDQEQQCENGNLNNQGAAYTYVYNAGRGTNLAKCGQSADCACCTQLNTPSANSVSSVTGVPSVSGYGTCVPFPTDTGDSEQQCANGNLNNADSHFTYVYNSGRGQTYAKCGQYADCYCCTQTRQQIPGTQGSGTCVSFPTTQGDSEQQCEDGNLNDDSSEYVYTYNAGRGTTHAKCGQYADCYCCQQLKATHSQAEPSHRSQGRWRKRSASLAQEDVDASELMRHHAQSSASPRRRD